ncbi:MAG: 3-keto-5-aminohexanoate cleavage protein [bacterium]|jgi:3-keto-5-aminohexanoate cleavage enzyme|nr:3-keto-5-aminohexanoate cleavage protein [bacterium]MDD4152605.1 3-keto-5-aminohexanoate cleavage protein [bacterium]
MKPHKADTLIINLALTGMVPLKEHNPHVPLTPLEIAADAERCHAAGAGILHLHARDEQGRPTPDPEIYRQMICDIKERCPQAVICVSTSGRLDPSYEKRSRVLYLQGDAHPDMASLTLGSMNFPQQASVNNPDTIVRLAATMQEQGIKPELEVFEPGMLNYALYLISKDILSEPAYVNILLGSLGTSTASPHSLSHFLTLIPDNWIWAVAGIGRFQLDCTMLAISCGGHIRTGLEDNLYYDRARLRPATNLDLVERTAELIRLSDRSVSTPGQTREILGLKKP